jgi:phage RecT family recombinase
MSLLPAQIQNAFEVARPQIESILPAHITIERFMQVANVSVLNNKEIFQCQPDSIISAMLACASDGLMPDGREAALLPFNAKEGNNWVKKAKYLPMVDGVLKRIRMSGYVDNVVAKVVYNGDQFDHYSDIDGEYLQHRPSYDAPRNKENIKLVYAIAKLKTGDKIVEVMTREEVERIMYSSKSAVDKNGVLKQNSVWGTFFDRMALKSCIHRLSKRLPNSSEIDRIRDQIEQEIDLKPIEGSYQEKNTAPKHEKPKIEKPEAEMIDYIDAERVKQLRALVEHTNSNPDLMWGWVSNITKRTVKDFVELDNRQADIIQSELEKKMSKMIEAERDQKLLGNAG